MTLALRPHAEACGKIILLGEHSVVFGHPALAAGLARGLVLRATPLENPRAPIQISVPRWGVDVELRVENEHPVARACLEVLTHCDGPVTGWRIEGEATIPSRAGLGSSAALSVALARLALPAAEGTAMPAMEDVVAASMVGERVFHGEPSGIDSEVAARGGVICFARDRGVEPIDLVEPLHLVVMPSGVPRHTGRLVAGVRARRDRFPTVIDPVLDALGALVDDGRGALERGQLSRLAGLTNIAHELLGALGVSLPILDDLCAHALAHGALAAKLTGAGGGGCAYALCASALDSERVVDGLREFTPRSPGPAPESPTFPDSSPDSSEPPAPPFAVEV